MTDTKVLKEYIADSGMTITHIAKKLDITREGLYNKINGVTEFKASEISALTQLLHLSNCERDGIFFAEKRE